MGHIKGEILVLQAQRDGRRNVAHRAQRDAGLRTVNDPVDFIRAARFALKRKLLQQLRYRQRRSYREIKIRLFTQSWIVQTGMPALASFIMNHVNRHHPRWQTGFQ